MNVAVHSDYESLSQAAVAWLLERIDQRPDALVCLAAGSTPARTYALLAEIGKRDPDRFAKLRFLKLDEWGGLGGSDLGSCESQLRHQLIEPLGAADRYVGFDGQAADPVAECRRVADWLAQHGPIDVCVLGLGLNGHLGFNEPAAALTPGAHVAQLTATSMGHDMVRDRAAAPAYGVTLGTADILLSREILLLASGAPKAAPLRTMLSGRVTAEFPASFLSLHRSVDVFCDANARPDGSRPC
jgi:galactosamine-6-phosphate isomerase